MKSNSRNSRTTLHQRPSRLSALPAMLEAEEVEAVDVVEGENEAEEVSVEEQGAEEEAAAVAEANAMANIAFTAISTAMTSLGAANASNRPAAHMMNPKTSSPQERRQPLKHRHQSTPSSKTPSARTSIWTIS